MKFSTTFATLAAIVSGATAQLSILSPGGSDLWWGALSVRLHFASLTLILLQSTTRLTTLRGPAPRLRTRTSPFCEFSVLSASVRANKINDPSLNSSNSSILASPYAFVAEQPNYQCSVEIYATQLAKFPPATGYTIIFASILNSSDVRSFS